MKTFRVLIVSDEGGAAAGENAVWALKQARIAFDRLGASPSALRNSGAYSAVILAVDGMQTLDLDALARFVAAGGGVVCIHRARAESAWDLFGITPPQGKAGDPYSEHHSEGVIFRNGAFPGFDGLELSGGWLPSHSALDLFPSRDAEVVARTAVGRPVAWRVRHGAGRVMFWNSSLLAEKTWRGLILESLSAVLPVCALPKANVAVFQADDFPAPLGVQGYSRWRRRQGHVPPSGFYAAQWFPDVLGIARRHGFPMTCFAVFCYTWQGQDIAPDVTDDRRKDCFAAFRARGGEVGLHGLNHKPLMRSHWDSAEHMADGLRRAMDLWQQQGLGPPPTAYVPPNNQYDADGACALAEALPSLRAICGGYDKRDTRDGGNREYGPEPFAERLFLLPRATSGHGCSPEVLPTAVAQVAATGVWSHFLHPDDIADVPKPGDMRYARRNPHVRPWRGFRGMRAELSGLLAQMRRRFPWLRGCGTAEAVQRLQDHLASDWSVESGPDGMRITGPVGGTADIRLNGDPMRAIDRMCGARTLHEQDGPGVCLRVIELEDTVVEITFRPLEAAA